MENDVLKFSNQLSESIKADKINGELDNSIKDGANAYDAMLKQLPSYKFVLGSYYVPGGMTYMIQNPITRLITLDNEDIQYFKNKYLPKVEDQYQKELDELNKKFNR